MHYKFLLVRLPLCLVLSAFATSCHAGRFYNETYNDAQRLELGAVQKGICEGMAQDQVALVLGSPNIVTSDKDKKETWIYDKIATEARQSGSSGLILFCQTGADYVSRADISQKTLTIVIKFDNEKKVESFSYHSSKF